MAKGKEEEEPLPLRFMVSEIWKNQEKERTERAELNITLAKEAIKITQLTSTVGDHSDYIKKDIVRQAKMAGVAGVLSFIGGMLVFGFKYALEFFSKQPPSSNIHP